MPTLHLMTQRDQPYGSVRKCCEICGSMMVARPDSFWLKNTWTDDPAQFIPWSDLPGYGNLEPCTTRPSRATDGGISHTSSQGD